MTSLNQDKDVQYSESFEFSEKCHRINFFSHDDNNVLCFICKCFVSEPYIRCAQCDNVLLCSQCFAHGKEDGEHLNSHDYVIIQNDFPIIENSNWSAKEERNLLSLIQICGFGNWINISKKLPGRSAEECEKHYLKNYIDNPFLTNLPRVEPSTNNFFDSKPIPFAYILDNTEKPLRFTSDNIDESTPGGYNAARSDFGTNHDDDAEGLVSHLKYDDFSSNDQNSKLGQALQLALFSSYNNRLKERARRKKIVRDHGLISCIKHGIGHLQRYNPGTPIPSLEKFLIFSQLISGIEFDAIMICLRRIETLKNHIRELKKYRKSGIRYFHSIPLFKELSNFRKESEKLKKCYPSSEESDFNYISSASIRNTVPTNNLRRKKAAPIEIHAGMPGFKALSSEEKELCSVLRLIPKDFIDFKNQLKVEDAKKGSVKLAEARKLLKIDVNKTRKIHEFLVTKGEIRIS